MGYKLVTMWEHDWNNIVKQENLQFHGDCFVERPKLRDSFYGGRTESYKLIYELEKKGVKGGYSDFVSLYPTVQYESKYPIKQHIEIFKPTTLIPNGLD